MLSLEFMGDIMHAQFISIWPDFVCSGKLRCLFAEGATSSLDENIFFSISSFFFFCWLFRS